MANKTGYAGPTRMPLELLVHLVDEAFERKAWHGTNLRGSLRGLSARTAVWRPASGRHNIWEIALHAAYWKYAVRRRLTGEKRGGFPREGSNWFASPSAPNESAWRDDVRLLVDAHRALRETLAGLGPAELPKALRGRPWYMIRGIAAHDLYHAGQIQLLKRLCS